MKSPYINVQEVRIKFFYKNVCEERMIPIYTSLQWQKEPKPTHKIHQKMDSTCFGPEFSPHSQLTGRNYKAAGLPTDLAHVPWLWPHQWEQAMLWSSSDQCILFHPNSTLLNRISRYFLYWDLLHSYKNIKTLQSLVWNRTMTTNVLFPKTCSTSQPTCPLHSISTDKIYHPK